MMYEAEGERKYNVASEPAKRCNEMKGVKKRGIA